MRKKQPKTVMVEDSIFEFIHEEIAGDVDRQFTVPRAHQYITSVLTGTRIRVKKEKIYEVLRDWRRDGYYLALIRQNITHEDLKKSKVWLEFLNILNSPLGWKRYIVCSVQNRFSGRYFQPKTYGEFQNYMEHNDVMFMRCQEGLGDTMKQWKMKTGKSHRLEFEGLLHAKIRRMEAIERPKLIASVIDDPKMLEALLDALVLPMKQNPKLYLPFKKKIEGEKPK